MDDEWLFIDAKRGGRDYVASVRLPFDPWQWPEYDVHVAVALPYAPHWRSGLPKSAKVLSELQEREDRWIAMLEGHGALVATETSDAWRTMHLYIRDGGPMAVMFREMAEQPESRKRPTVAITPDPGWEGVAHLTRVVLANA